MSAFSSEQILPAASNNTPKRGQNRFFLNREIL